MSKRILYHGSPNILEHPLFGKGKKYNDYGRGFYCTEHPELAKEWACSEGVDGYANRYEIETDGLSIMNLSSDRYTILNWLAILLENRQGRLSSPIEKRGREYLLCNYTLHCAACKLFSSGFMLRPVLANSLILFLPPHQAFRVLAGHILTSALP